MFFLYDEDLLASIQPHKLGKARSTCYFESATTEIFGLHADNM